MPFDKNTKKDFNFIKSLSQNGFKDSVYILYYVRQ